MVTPDWTHARVGLTAAGEVETGLGDLVPGDRARAGVTGSAICLAAAAFVGSCIDPGRTRPPTFRVGWVAEPLFAAARAGYAGPGARVIRRPGLVAVTARRQRSSSMR